MVLLLDTLFDKIHSSLSKKIKNYVWIQDKLNTNDIEAIQTAAQDTSPFDTLHLRKQMFESLQKGNANLYCYRLVHKASAKELAKIILILSQRTLSFPDLQLWKKIFVAFGSPGAVGTQCHTTLPWRVILFGSPVPRLVPKDFSEPVSATHVNGGYAYPGRPESIVIYRAEESTRVLVHELLHACGSDDMNDSEEKREVKTESWAELFLVILTATSKKDMRRRWHLQSRWIMAQEIVLRQLYQVNQPSDYAWRYLVGRSETMNSFGQPIQIYSMSLQEAQDVIQGSLRFLHPYILPRNQMVK